MSPSEAPRFESEVHEQIELLSRADSHFSRLAAGVSVSNRSPREILVALIEAAEATKAALENELAAATSREAALKKRLVVSGIAFAVCAMVGLIGAWSDLQRGVGLGAIGLAALCYLFFRQTYRRRLRDRRSLQGYRIDVAFWRRTLEDWSRGLESAPSSKSVEAQWKELRGLVGGAVTRS